MLATLAVVYCHMVDAQQSALTVERTWCAHMLCTFSTAMVNNIFSTKLRPECGASTWLSRQHYCHWQMLNVP